MENTKVMKKEEEFEIIDCPKCHGTGREEFNHGFLSRKCPKCRGTKHVKRRIKVEKQVK